jgi:hypothetical protein
VAYQLALRVPVRANRRNARSQRGISGRQPDTNIECNTRRALLFEALEDA